MWFWNNKKTQLERIEFALHLIGRKVDRISMTQAELAAQLTAAKDQADKAKTEILAKIAALESALGTVSPEVEAALAGLKTGVQGLDDIIPDAPTP